MENTHTEIDKQPEAWTANLNSFSRQIKDLAKDLPGLGKQAWLVTGCGSTHYASLSAAAVLFGSDYTINDPAGVIARIQAADFDAESKGKLLGGNLMRLLSEHGWKD